MWPVLDLDILNVLPWVFGIVILVAIVSLIIFIVVRRFGRVVEGLPLGNFHVIGRDSDNNIVLDITGQLIETPKFMSRTKIPAVKAFLFLMTEAKIAMLKKNETENTQAIKTISADYEKLKKLSDDDFLKMGRIVAMRDGMQKYVLLQWKYTEKPLSQYAAKNLKPKLDLSFGFTINGLIEGKASLKMHEAQKFPDFGNFQLYSFEPLFVDNEKSVDYPSWLGDLMIYVPTIVQMEEQLKSKDTYIVDLERRLAKDGNVISGAKTETDFHRDTMRQFGRTDDPKKFGKLDLLDFACVSLPTIIFSVIGMSVSVETGIGAFVGTIAGLFTGLAIVGFKKR
jgi:hypothetical protein